MAVVLSPRPAALLRAVGVLGVLAVVLSGCAGTGKADSAQSTAEAFAHALADGDGGTACRLLAPDTAKEVAESGGGDCATAILDEDLPDGGAVRTASAWGHSAQVRMAADTLFLSHFDDGWKVLAAGCTPQPDKPYDCTVQGG